MREPEFDPRIVDWLGDSRSAPSDWVLPSVEAHARRHPRRRAVLVTAMLRRPFASAARYAVVIAAVAVAVGLGSVFFSASPGLISTPGPTPTRASPTAAPSVSATPSPVVTPAPAVVDRAALLSGYLDAWRLGDRPWAEQHLANDHATVLIGDTALTDGHTLAKGSEHFQIVPGGRGYVYWESRGDPIHGGAVSALPTVAGVWDPGNLVWAVFRLDGQGRIATQWLIIRPSPLSGHEEGGTHVTSAPATVVTFLDGCREAFADRLDFDVGRYRAAVACYGPGAGIWVSANEPSGAWTEAYTDDPKFAPDGPIHAWTQASRAYQGVDRTGDVMMLGDIAAYPFRQSFSSSCAAGIDILELAPTHDSIRSHWVFCGPDPLPPSSLPPEIIGTWGIPPLDRLSVTLGTCQASGVCGEFRRLFDGQYCIYALTYRGAQGDERVFLTNGANSFHCAYDLTGATMTVRPTADGLEVSVDTPGAPYGFTLPRAATPPG